MVVYASPLQPGCLVELVALHKLVPLCLSLLICKMDIMICLPVDMLPK